MTLTRLFSKHRATKSNTLLAWMLTLTALTSLSQADEQTPYIEHVAESSRANAQNLEQAWATALGNSRLLKQSEAETRASNEKVKASESLRWPTLTLSSQYTQLKDPVTGKLTVPGALFAVPNLPPPPDKTIPFSSEDHSSLTQLQLKLPLYAGGRISAGIESAKTARELQSIQLALTKQKIKLQVVNAYIGLLRSDKAHKVGEDYFEALKLHAQDVDALLKKGLVARNDALATEVALANGRQQLLKLSNLHDLAMANFNRQLGLALDTPVKLQELDSQAEPQNLQTLQAEAQEQRLELRALALQGHLSDEQIKSLRGENLPQLQAQLVSTKLDQSVLDENVINYAGLALSWQLFDGQKNSHLQQAVTEQKQGISEATNDARQDVALQVKSAWMNVQESRQRIDVAQSALSAAEENLRVTRDRYRNGLGTQADVLDAQVAWSLNINRYHDARYDAIASHYQLLAATGAL